MRDAGGYGNGLYLHLIYIHILLFSILCGFSRYYHRESWVKANCSYCSKWYFSLVHVALQFSQRDKRIYLESNMTDIGPGTQAWGTSKSISTWKQFHEVSIVTEGSHKSRQFSKASVETSPKQAACYSPQMLSDCVLSFLTEWEASVLFVHSK